MKKLPAAGVFDQIRRASNLAATSPSHLVANMSTLFFVPGGRRMPLALYISVHLFWWRVEHPASRLGARAR